MRHVAGLGLGLALVLFGDVESARGEDPAKLTPEQEAKARVWLKQLGDRSYQVREKATRELEGLGRAAKHLFEEGVKSDDAEVRRRCERLLKIASRTETEIALRDFLANKDSKRLLKLPAWKRFSKYAGEGEAARRLFVEMYSHEGPLLAALEKAPAEFGPKLTARLRQIQQTRFGRVVGVGQRQIISHGQVVALLFMATEPRVKCDATAFSLMQSLFYQPQVQQGFKDNAGSRKLLVAFLEERSTPQTVASAFQIARQLNLKEALPLAVKAIKQKGGSAYTRGYAALFIAQMGGKKHAKEIKPLLEDKTRLGTIQAKDLRVETQLRDVALAALIQLSGQNVMDYDFPFLKRYGGKRGMAANLSPNYFGFTDDSARAKALKKWKESQAKK